MRKQVMGTPQTQSARFRDSRTRHNRQMTHRQTRQFCQLDDECRNLLKGVMSEMSLSARAHDKILGVARTIDDLDQSPDIHSHHLTEAINYPIRDRQLWT